MSRARPRIPVGTLVLDYSSSNVTTSPVQLAASLGQDVNFLSVNDTSNLANGTAMTLMFGPSGSETESFQFASGSARDFNALLNKGMRISIKAAAGTATTGKLTIGLFQ